MTYDDWKLRSDRDDNPYADDPIDSDEPWDEPVSCIACGRIHELQASYFCHSCKGGGYCLRCWPDGHVCSRATR